MVLFRVITIGSSQAGGEGSGNDLGFLCIFEKNRYQAAAAAAAAANAGPVTSTFDLVISILLTG